MTLEELEKAVKVQQAIIEAIMESLTKITNAVLKNSDAISMAVDCIKILEQKLQK